MSEEPRSVEQSLAVGGRAWELDCSATPRVGLSTRAWAVCDGERDVAMETVTRSGLVSVQEGIVFDADKGGCRGDRMGREGEEGGVCRSNFHGRQDSRMQRIGTRLRDLCGYNVSHAVKFVARMGTCDRIRQDRQRCAERCLHTRMNRPRLSSSINVCSVGCRL